MASLILPTLFGVVAPLAGTFWLLTSLSVTMNQSVHPFTRALFGFLASVSLTTTIMVVLAA